ncbi:hypothetical protein LEMLEM_LOCUS11531 [Lemmus lemmus]
MKVSQITIMPEKATKGKAQPSAQLTATMEDVAPYLREVTLVKM